MALVAEQKEPKADESYYRAQSKGGRYPHVGPKLPDE